MVMSAGRLDCPLASFASSIGSTCQNVSFNVSLEVSKSGLSVSVLAEILWFCANWGRVPPSPPKFAPLISCHFQKPRFGSVPIYVPGLSMYHTRHGNDFRFQRRIPHDLVPILGTSPMRLNLCRVSNRQAATICRLLAARLDRLFAHTLRTEGKTMAQKQDPRDTIIAELQAEVDYLMRSMKEVSVSEAGGYCLQGLQGRHG